MGDITRELEALVRDRLVDWPAGWEGYHWPGYTYEHTLRVRDLALVLAAREGADPDIVRLAALLHDIRKDAGREHAPVGAEESAQILADHGINGQVRSRVCDAIASHSGDNTPAGPPENLCLGDADLIDSNFGLVATWRFVTIRSGRDFQIYDTIAAMAEWLPQKNALLTGLLTRSGREIARQRAARMQVFCEQLMQDVQNAHRNGTFGLLDLVEHIHNDRGRHFLAEQLVEIERETATRKADGMVKIVCRSLRAEISGLH